MIQSSGHLRVDLAGELDRREAIGPAVDAIAEADGLSSRIGAIRRFYREFEAVYGGAYDRVDPYLSGIYQLMTPIEVQLWQDIRGRLPMAMQYPVGRFLVDFGDPARRLALEADGKGFHDPGRDKARDDELWLRHGWKVYRVSGAECYRVRPSPGEFRADWHADHDEEPGDEAMRRAAVRFYSDTATGVVAAMAAVEYGEEADPAFDGERRAALRLHRLAAFPIGRGR